MYISYAYAVCTWIYKDKNKRTLKIENKIYNKNRPMRSVIRAQLY